MSLGVGTIRSKLEQSPFAVVAILKWVWLRIGVVISIVSVYIINKAGGLIFSHDVPSPVKEAEGEFAQYPVTGLMLEEVDRNIMVRYGEIKDMKDQGEKNAVLGE